MNEQEQHDIPEEGNPLNEVSMNIILHAGNARTLINEALDAVKENRLEEAEVLLTDAKQNVRLAHKAQTRIIQAEARGEQHQFSLIFAHAQDTLMTVMSEWNIAKQLLQLFGCVDQRLSALEARLEG